MAKPVRVCRRDEVAPGEFRCVEVEGTRILLYDVSGVLYATSATCAHLGGPLDMGVFEEGRRHLSLARLAVRCAHRGVDLRSGPARRNLPRLRRRRRRPGRGLIWLRRKPKRESEAELAPPCPRGGEAAAKGVSRRGLRAHPRDAAPAPRRDHPFGAVHRRAREHGHSRTLRALSDGRRIWLRRIAPSSRRSSARRDSSGTKRSRSRARHRGSSPTSQGKYLGRWTSS